MTASSSSPAPGGELLLTVVIPCLNEARTIAGCVDQAMAMLAASGIAGEVVVGDNGSTDGSQDIARERGARVVNVPERGYGAALLGGIAAARGRYVIMGDADGSYDFGHAPRIGRIGRLFKGRHPSTTHESAHVFSLRAR